jgi:hypothetical protein
LDLVGGQAALEAELKSGFLRPARDVLIATFQDSGLDLGVTALEWVGVANGDLAHIKRSSRHSDDPYADVVVHEAAHLLHSLKPARLGLRPRHGQERFVDVEFRHRELFAHACEAYTRISGIKGRQARLTFADSMERDAVSFPREERAAVASLVRDAAGARNGWKVIQRATCAKRSH